MDFEAIVANTPKLKRGTVWCVTCGRAERGKGAQWLQAGFPKCCGQTMSLDSPTERTLAASA